MSADNTNTTKKTSETSKQVSEASREAFLMFTQMQAMYDANTLKLGAKLLDKPKPYISTKKNEATGLDETRSYHRLTFGFTGGSITESVDEELYNTSNLGDKFLLEGFIKSTAENKNWEDKKTGESKSYAATTLNPAITKITRLDLTSFADLSI